MKTLRAGMGVPVCLLALALLAGCAGESQTVSSSQGAAKPQPPPPPVEERIEAPAAPPAPAPEPPPPAPQQEMVAQAAAPAEDPLAWAAGVADVHFSYCRSRIRKSDRPGLDALAQKLKEDGARKIVIEGHCDDRGTSNYNMTLGEWRAKSVRRYLLKAGVPAAQLEIVSYGKERPLCTDATDECRQSNRRAHVQPQ